MGYIAALFIGIALGLIGGGGSILTVPVLVYLFKIPPITATSYSLFIVGVTSLIGAINNYRKQLIDVRTTVLFGLTSIAIVFVVRRFIIHKIPEEIHAGNFTLHFPVLTMVLFAVLMILASISMIFSHVTNEYQTKQKKQLAFLLLCGIIIGLITGFLGAGGGFLLIPALVLLIQLPMKKAIGTSLLIIALNALIGFGADLGHLIINWKFLLIITSIAITGVVIGGLLSYKIQGNKLKKGFGMFVLVMGTYIILHEIFIK